MSHHTKLITLALLQCTLLSAMEKNTQRLSSQPLRLQLFTAIKENDAAKVPKLLLVGAKVNIKSKKN